MLDKSPGSGEDKTPDSICDNGVKKNNTASAVASNTTNTTNRAKKRKKIPRDATAPKQPLTGYFRYSSFSIQFQCSFSIQKCIIKMKNIFNYNRFLNDRREKVRTENPTLSFAEITKLLASEWSTLPADQKQQYLDAAEQDKERYNREFSDYKQTEAYRLFSEKQSSEKQQENKKERNGTDVNSEQNV